MRSVAKTCQGWRFICLGWRFDPALSHFNVMLTEIVTRELRDGRQRVPIDNPKMFVGPFDQHKSSQFLHDPIGMNRRNAAGVGDVHLCPADWEVEVAGKADGL